MSMQSSSYAPSRTHTLDDELAAVGSSWERTRGSRVGRYLIEQRIGAGAMGVVYQARDPQLDRAVAIKLIHPSRASLERSHERFMREARAMARLAHPNVVAVYDFGISNSEAFLVMELVDAVTLSHWMTDEPTRSRRLQVMLEAGRGLFAAHAEGIVHRDIKPQNILIDGEGHARVTDFGLAVETEERTDSRPLGESSVDSTSGVLTRHGAVVGSPAYMSPEQHQGARIDARSDQYSYCITLFEVLTGRRPFVARSVEGMRTKKEDGVARIDWTGVPRSLQSVLRRGLDPEASRRFPNLGVLLSAMSRAPQQRLWLLGGTVIGGGLMLAVPALGSSPNEECGSGAEHLRGVWGPIEAAGLESSFEATEHPLAASTSQRVRSILDAQADAWVETYTDACRTSDDAQLDAQMACLRDRQEELSTLVARLSDVSAKTLPRAVARAARLESPQSCLEDEADSTGFWDRLDADGQAAVDESSLFMRRGKQALREGDREAALEHFAAAIATARTTGDTKAISTALTKIGNLEDNAGAPKLAQRHLEEALELASVSGDDDRAAAALIHLVWVEGISLGDTTAGLRRVRETESFLERSGNPPEKVAALYNNHAVMLHSQGDVAGAREVLERARVVWDDVHPETAAEQVTKRLAVAGLDHNIGAMSYYLEDLDRAVEALSQAYSGVAEAKGQSHPDAADELITLSRVYDRQGRYERAVEKAEAALDVLIINRGEDDLTVAEALIALTYALYGNGRYDEALAATERALIIRRKLLGDDHPDVHSAASEKAEILVENGQFDEAEAVASVVIGGLAEAGPDYTRDRAQCHTILGRVAASRGDVAEAVAQARRAAAVVHTTPGKTESEWAAIWIAISMIYRDAGYHDEAVEAATFATDSSKQVPQTFVGRMSPLQLALALCARAGSTDLERAGALIESVGPFVGAEPILVEALADARTAFAAATKTTRR